MKTYFSVSFGRSSSMDFGIANNTNEILEYKKIRKRVYVKHDYIVDNGRDIDEDEYDNDKTVYIIASDKDGIVGGARLIFSEKLPIEKDCFVFYGKDNSILADKKVEIGRLVVDIGARKFVPRNVTMLGIFFVASTYLLDEEYQTGYAFIKKSLLIKLQNLKAPFQIIENYKQVYNKKLLYKYFNDKNNPVVPVVFNIKETHSYCREMFNKKIFFKKTEKGYIIRNIFIWNKLRKYI